MGNEYKLNLELGDIAISSTTQRRYRQRMANVNANNEEMRNINDNERDNFFDQDMPETDLMEVENEIDENAVHPRIDDQENITVTDAQASSSNSPETQVVSNLCNAESESESEDIAMLNYIKEFLIDECNENLIVANKPASLIEFVQSEGFLEKINTRVNRSPGELLFMVLNYSIENSLSTKSMINMFKFVNIIFEEPVLPDWKYLIDKLLNPQSNVDFHAVCHGCSSYIGNFENVKSIETCPVCNINIDLSKACNSSFFVIIDPSEPIKDLLHIYEEYYDGIMNGRNRSNNSIADIYDGKLYKKFINSLPEQQKKNYVSAIFNTDGAPKFKSSQFSIWPIYLMLNELPIQDRLKQLLCCGLWINRAKPDMSVVLDPFVDKMIALSSEGIICEINNEERSIKLFVLVCCVDSVARAPVQGIKQFNGHYGCSWCEHPDVWMHGSMRYPILEQTPSKREEQSMLHYMLQVEPNEPILGIKNPSPFINLPYFNIVQGFVPDYMHCALEGVGKQFTNHYLSLISADEIKDLDEILKQIKFPCQISRLTRPLSVRDDWRAREWENFILFSSIPIYK